MTLTAENKNLAGTLIDGAQRAFRNAEELFFEAQLLAQHGGISRAFLLHQISLEECGKIEMLTAATTNLLQGGAVDMKRLAKSITKHESKNKSNAYFLPQSEEESAAIVSGDTAASVAAFSTLQDEFHENSNILKNASLYVKFDGKFSSPSDIINQEKLLEIVERNSEFLSLTQPKIEMLSRWNVDLEGAAAEVSGLFSALGLGQLERGASVDAQGFLEDLVRKMMAMTDARGTVAGSKADDK